MVQSTDYTQQYGQAEKAYLQGNYEEAANLIDHLAAEYPEDPTVTLLRGHIYCYGLQDYAVAQEQYERVLQLTEESDFVDYATNGLEQVQQFQQEFGSMSNGIGASDNYEGEEESYEDYGSYEEGESLEAQDWQEFQEAEPGAEAQDWQEFQEAEPGAEAQDWQEFQEA